MSTPASALPTPANTFTQLSDAGVFRQLFAMLVLAGAIAGGLWLFFWLQKPPMAVLQDGLDPRTSAELVDLLRQQQLPFELDPATGAVKVPAERLQEARLQMAAAGLGQLNGSGMEMIERDPGFGVSQFVETARYQRALETELARTIGNLRPVREARVHLAIPKPSAFTRQREPAAASVVLQLHAGRTLERNQVDAIVHLVASSIPGLTPERVTVVDGTGRLLTLPDGAEDPQATSAEQFERIRRQESSFSARIDQLLEPITGAGRVRSQVAVDMDFSATEEAREVYGPDSAQVRSEQLTESERRDGEGHGPQGIPGATANTPPGPAAAGAPADPAADPAAPSPPTESNRSETRNYELDRTLSHTRQPPGRIRRVTVAVLVDHVPGVDAEGNPIERALTADELTRIEALVKEAVGFDANRGDSVSVMNAPFIRPELEEPGEGAPFWENPTIRELLRIGLGAIVVLVLIFAVLRPALRTLISPPRTRTEVDAGDAQLQAQANLPALAQAQAAQIGNDGAQPQLALPPNSYEARLDVARQAVNEDSKRVAQVVKEWVASDG